MTVQMLQASLQNSESTEERLTPVGTDPDEWARYERANGRQGKLEDDDTADLSFFRSTIE